MKIIVTGCFGFIGINFLYFILKKSNNNIKIIGVDKLTSSSNKSYVKLFGKYNNFKFYKTDINSKEISKIIEKEKPTNIINFAAESHVDNSINTPDKFIRTNINGVYNLLKYSLIYYKNLKKNKKKEFKFLQISTDEVYGSLLKGSAKEDHKYFPSSPYSASKAAANHLVDAWFKTYNFPSIITYCSNNFGPFQNIEKLIPKIIDCLKKNKKIPVYGDGKNLREWIFVEDHVSAIYKILKLGKSGEKYNIGTNKKFTNLEIVKIIISEYIKINNTKNYDKLISLITFVDDRLGHDYRYSIDSSKIKDKIKWRPKTSFLTGINKTIKWYLIN